MMQGETSKVGHQGMRIPMSNSSYENTVPLCPLSSYFGGDMEAFRPSELELMMMASRSNHSSFLKDPRDRQALMDRQHALLSYMEKVAKEAQALREENISLKMMNSQLADQLVGLQKANSHLAYQLTAVHKATSYYAAAAAGHSGLGFGLETGHEVDSMLTAMERMALGGKSEEENQHGFDWENDLEDAVNVDHADGKENVATNPDRVSLPKSISVRSPGYLKAAQRGESRLIANKQKILVSGGEKEEEALELDVYDQGMLKTELCNKWQETGACPYGESCQFAHGIKELRPIIRHPRYKTEVCRMILSGVHCSYGHRCHFRHTLSDEEKLMRSMSTARPPRNLKTI